MAAVRTLLTDRWTYLRLLYMLIAFPLATFYFVVIVTGISIGIGTAIVMIGFPILVLTLLAAVGFGRVERLLAIHLLGAKVGPSGARNTAPLTLVQRLQRLLADPVTWKSLVYVTVEFPFSIVTFTLVIALLTTSLSLLFTPVLWVGASLFDPAFPSDAFQGSGWPGPGFAHTSAANQTLAVMLVSAVGAMLTLGSIALVNGLGVLWGGFARLMLGMDDRAVQLAAAKAEATTQKQRAESADRSRRELIVNASHELRTPVASISAHVESLLKPGRRMDKETRQYLGVVAAETERLSSLVDDVLILARADADELHLNIRPTAVEQTIAQVCDTLAPLARRERNLRLVHSEAAGLPRVMADRERLAQVLTNLVRNAVNHTPEGGIISVSAVVADDHVAVAVSDTGIGIDPDDLVNVFDRFYRTDGSRTRDTGGTGLGLSIVRDLLTAMGGSITAHSTPGTGSVFTVLLRKEAS